jgi:hypothetical protein
MKRGGEGGNPSDEQVRKWLKMAEHREINVFVDHCAIIKILCRALLSKRGLPPYSSGGTKGGGR